MKKFSVIIFLFSLPLYGVLRTWNGSTDSDWHRASNWIPKGVPTTADSVKIPSLASGRSCPRIFSDDAECGWLIIEDESLTVDKNLSVEHDVIIRSNGILRLNSNYTISVGGHWIDEGTLRQIDGTIEFEEGAVIHNEGRFKNILISGEISINDGDSAKTDSLKIISSGILNAGNDTRLIICKKWENNGVFNYGTGTVVLAGDMGVPDETYYNLEIAGECTLKTDITCENDFVVTSTGICRAEDETLTVKGDFKVVNFDCGTGCVIFAGSSVETLQVTGATSYLNDLVINATGTVIQVTSITVQGKFVLKNGTYNQNGNTINLSGTEWLEEAGTFQHGQGKISISTTNSLFKVTQLSTNSFYDFEVLSGDTIRMLSDLTIDGDFTLENAYFDPQSYVLKVKGNFDVTNGEFKPNAGRVELGGNTHTYIYTSPQNHFYNLWIVADTVEAESCIAIYGDFSIQNNATFIPSPYRDTVKGDWSDAGGIFKASQGGIVFCGVNQQITQGAGNYFNDLILRPTNTVTALSNITVNGALYLESGKFDPGSYTHRISGNWDDTQVEFTPTAGEIILTGANPQITTSSTNNFYSLTIDGGNAVANTSLRIFGDFKIINGGSFDPGNYVDTIKGDFDVSGGAFSPSAGEIVFAGTSPQINLGSGNKFNRLTINVTGTALMSSKLIVDSLLKVVSGEFDLSTGYYDTLKDSVYIGQSGELNVSGSDLVVVGNLVSDGVLHLYGSSILRLAKGVLIRETGSFISEGAAPTVTSISPSTYYSFKIRGTVNITKLYFSYANSEGMVIDTPAVIQNISNVIFENVEPGGNPSTHLHIYRQGTYNVTLIGLYFDATCDTNIHADGAGGNVKIFVSGYSGPKAGEAYDEETNGAEIKWLIQKRWTGAVDSLWSNPNNWKPAGVPDESSDVVIPDTIRDPVLDVAGYAFSVKINPGAKLKLKSNVLYIFGNFEDNGKLIPGTGKLCFRGEYNQSIKITDSSSIYDLDIYKLAGKVVAYSSLDIDGKLRIREGEFDPQSFTHTIAGDFENISGVFRADAGTFIFDGDTQRITLLTGDYFNNLVINVSDTVWALSDITVKGNFEIQGGCYDAGSYTHRVGGDYDDTGGRLLTSGKFVFDGDSSNVWQGANNQFADVEINVTNCVVAQTSLKITGDFTILGGEFIPQSYTHYIEGNWDDRQGKFAPSSGEIVFNGTGIQVIYQDTSKNNFYNLKISSNCQALTPLKIFGDFTLSSGSFVPGSYIEIKGDWVDTGGTFTPTSGIVHFTGIKQDVKTGSGNNFYNVKVEVEDSLKAQSSLNVDGYFKILSGVFYPDSYTHYIGGTWWDLGGVFNPSSGKIVLDGYADSIYQDTTKNAFYNLEINTAYSKKANTGIIVKGNFVITQGEFIPPQTVMKVYGDWDSRGGIFHATSGWIGFPGKSNIYLGTGNYFYNFGISTSDTIKAQDSLNIHGMFWIYQQGVFDGGNFTHRIKGDFKSADGKLLVKNSKIILNGEVQNIDIGTDTLYLLVIESDTVKAQSNLMVLDSTKVKSGVLILNSKGLLTGKMEIGQSGGVVMKNSGGGIAADTVIVAGLMKMEGAAQLQLVKGIEVASTGKFVTRSVGNAQPLITHRNSGQYYGFGVKGEIDVEGAIFRYLNSNGLYIYPAATLTDLSSVRFDSLQRTAGTDRFLQIYRSGTFDKTIYDHYYDTVYAGDVNIHIDGGVSTTDTVAKLKVFYYAGSGAGEAYDEETNGGAVLWTMGKVWVGGTGAPWPAGTHWRWSKAHNWDPPDDIPKLNDKVLIPQRSVYPHVDTLHAECASILLLSSTMLYVDTVCTLNVSGDVELKSGAKIVQDSNSVIRVGGNWKNMGGVFDQRSGLVEFYGANAKIWSTTFLNIKITGAGVGIADGETVKVTNSFNLLSGATFYGGNNAVFDVKGWNNSGGTFDCQTGEVIVRDTIVPNEVFYNLTIGANAKIPYTKLVVKNDLKILSTKTLRALNCTLYVGGDFMNNGSFDAGSGIVIFNGTGNQEIKGNAITFNKLIVDKTGGVLYAKTSITVTDFKLRQGEFNPGNFTHYVKGNWDDAGGVFTPDSGMIVICGTGKQQIKQGTGNNFYKLKIALQNAQDTVEFASSIDVNSEFIMQNGVIIPGAYTHYICGNWDDALCTFKPSQGEIVLDDADTIYIKQGANNNFANLTINTGSVVNLETNIKVNNFTLQSGYLKDAVACTLWVDGDWIEAGGNTDFDAATVILQGSTKDLQLNTGSKLWNLVIDVGSTDTVEFKSQIDVNGDFVMKSGVILPGAYTHYIASDWVDTLCEFVQTEGGVVLDGISPVIYQKEGNKFNNLTINVSGVATAKTKLLIGGDFTLQQGTFSIEDTVICGGNWSDAGGTFTDLTGTVKLIGENATINQGATNHFNNLIIEGTGRIETQTNITVKGNLRIISGTFYLGDALTHTVDGKVIAEDSLHLGQSELKVSDSLIIKETGVLYMENQCVLTLGKAALIDGKFEAFGTTPKIQNDGINYYSFKVRGEIEVLRLVFSGADVNGMYIDTSATIIDLSNVSFQSVQPGGNPSRHLQIHRNADFEKEFLGCSFDASCDTNVYANGYGNSVRLIFSDYSGPKGGEDYDEEVNGAEIIWMIKKVWTGAQDTLWSNPFNWDPVGLPADTEDVVIPGGLTNYPVLDMDDTIASLNIETGARFKEGPGGSYTLVIKGNMHNMGRFDAGDGTIEFTGLANQIALGDSGEFYNLVINKQTGSITAGGPIIIKNNITLKSGEFIPGVYTHIVGGGWYEINGTFRPTSGKILFNGQNAVIKQKEGNYFHNIEIDVDNNLTLQTDVVVKGDVKITSGQLILDTFELQVEGNWDSETGVIQDLTGTVIFAGNKQQINVSANDYFNNLVIQANDTVTALDSIKIMGDFKILQGVYYAQSYTHRIGGDFYAIGGYFKQDAGKVIFIDSSQIYTDDEIFNDFVCEGTAIAKSNLQINGDVEIKGKFIPGDYTHTVNGNWIDTLGEFKAQEGEIILSGVNKGIYQGTGNNFYNLTISGNITAYTSINVDGDITITGTFNPGSFTHRVAGDWDDEGGIFNQISGTIIFDGVTQQINTKAGNYFNNVICEVTNKLIAADSLDINGDFVILSGEFVPNAYTHRIGGNWADTGGIFIDTTSTIIFDGTKQKIYAKIGNHFNNVKINPSDTVWAMTALKTEGYFAILSGTFIPGNFTHEIGGDWYDKGGVFKPTGGTIILNGENPHIYTSATNNFYNLTIDVTGVATAEDGLNINGALLINAGELYLSDGLTHKVASGVNVYGTLDLGTSVLEVGTGLNVQSGGVLKLIGSPALKLGTQLYIANGGKIFTSGSPEITAKDTTKPFDFNVYGELEIDGLTISYIDTGGLCIYNQAQITRLDEVKFTNQRGTGHRVYMQIYRNADFNATFSLHSYDQYCDTNVYADGGGNNVDIIMSGASGSKAGENYDHEVNGANIEWTSADVWVGGTNSSWWDAVAAGLPASHNAKNWSLGRPPVDTELVIIPANANNNYPILNITDTCAGVLIKSGAKLTMNSDKILHVQGDFTIKGQFDLSDGTLFVWNDFTNDGVFNHTGGWVVIESTGVISGKCTFYNLKFADNSNVSVNYGDTLKITNNFIIGTNADFHGGTNTLIQVYSWNNSGKFHYEQSTVEFLADMTLPQDTFYNLVINAIDSLNAELICMNDLHIKQTLKGKGYTIYVGGDWINDGNFIHGGSDVVFNGGSDQYVKGGLSAFDKIIINSTGGELIAQDGLTIEGDFMIYKGGFEPSSYTHYVKGDWVDTGGIFRPSAGKIVFNGAVQHILTDADNYFYEMEINADSVYFDSPIDVNGALYMLSGVIEPWGYVHEIAGDWVDTAVIFTQDSGKIILDGNKFKIIQGSNNNFANLEIRASDTVFAQSALKIYGDFMLSSGIFEAGSYTHTVRGDWIDTGGVFTAEEGKILFDGKEGEIWQGANNYFANIEIKVQDTLSAKTNITLKGDFVLNSGVFDAPSLIKVGADWIDTGGVVVFPANADVWFTGSVSNVLQDTVKNRFQNFTIKTSNTYLKSSIICEGNLTIESGSLNPGSYTHIVYGNFTSQGVFTADSGKFVFRGDASAQVELANGNYFNTIIIEKNLSQLTASSALTLKGDFILKKGTFYAGSYTHTVEGNWIDTGGVFQPTDGKIVLTGRTSKIYQGENNYFANLDITPNLTDTIIAETPIRVKGDITISGGRFEPGAFTHIIEGNWNDQNGKFNPTAGEIKFEGDTIEIITSSQNNFYNLTLNSQKVTPLTGLKINSKLKLLTGELDIQTGVHTVEDSVIISGNLKMTGGELRGKYIVINDTLIMQGASILKVGETFKAQEGSYCEFTGLTPQITALDTLNRFSFRFSGKLNCERLKFSYADSDGFYIDTLAEIISLNNVSFEKVGNKGKHLQIYRKGLFIQNFTGCYFDASCSVNVYADGGGDSTVIYMVNYSGAKAGESYDEEVNKAHIYWIAQRVWQGDVDSLWSNPNNWSPPGVPTDTEDVVIPDTAVRFPYLDTNAYCMSLRIDDSAYLHCDTFKLYLKGDLIVNGTLYADSGEIIFCGDYQQVINLTPQSYFYNLTINKNSGKVLCQSPINIKGDFVLLKGEFSPASYIHYVEGNWIDTGGTFTATSGEIRFTGNSEIWQAQDNNFANIKIAGTVTAKTPLKIYGDITITGTFNPDTFTHEVKGDWSDVLGTFHQTGGKIKFTGNYQKITSSQTNYFNNVEINCLTSVEAFDSLHVHGDFVINKGKFIAGSFTHYIGGDWVDTGGTFNPVGGKIVLTGKGEIWQKASNYFINLEIDGDTIWQKTDIFVKNDFTVKSGVFIPSDNVLEVRGDFDASGGEFKADDGTVYLAGGAQQIKLGTGNYLYNLSMAPTASVTALDSLVIKGDLTLLSGEFIPGSYTHRIYGDWNTVSGTFAPTSGKVIFLGSKSTVKLGNGNNFYDIKIEKTDTLKALSKLRIYGDIELASGIFVPDTFTHTVKGDWIETGCTFRPTGGKIIFAGTSQNITQLTQNNFYSVIVKSTGTVTAQSSLRIYGDFVIEAGEFVPGTYTHYVKGNWNDTLGTFTPSAGEIILCGENQEIYQKSTNNFYDVIIDSGTQVVTKTGTQIDGKLWIKKGKFDFVNRRHTIRDSIIVDSILTLNSSVVSANSYIIVNSGGLLQLSGSCTLKVADTLFIENGGKFSANGVTPTITSINNLSYFGFEVRGEIDVTALNVNRVCKRGLRIWEDAQIAALDGINFTNIESGGTFLQIYRNAGYTATFSGHSYDASCQYNFHLKCTSPDSAIVTMVAYSGDKAGDAYDTTTQYARIEWILADVWTGTVDDRWDNPSNWQDGTVPTATDQVIIQDAPFDPTVNTTAQCAAIFVKNGANVNLTVPGMYLDCNGNVKIEKGGGINLISKSTIFCAGTWIDNGTFQQTAGVVTFDGTNCITNSETFKSLVISGDTLSLAAGVTVTVTDSFHIGTGAVFKGGEGAIFKTSSWINQGKFMPQTGTVILQAKMDVPEDTFYNLTIDADTIKLTNNLVILNDLQINAGRVFKANDDTIRIKGDWINNGEFIPDSSTCIFCGDQPQQISQSKFYNLIIENSYSTKKEEKDSTKQVASVTATGPLTIYGDFKILKGEFDPGSYTHIVMGDWIDTGGTFTPSAGEIVIAKDSVKIIQGQNNYFYNLKFQDADFVLSGKSVLKVQNVLTIDQNSAFIIDSLAEVKVGANLIAKGKFIAKGLMPSITSTQQGVKYPEVRLKGNVSISRLLCDGISGLILDTTSQIDTLENVWFMNMSSLSKALRVIKTSAYSDTYSGLLFDTTCYKNISANGAGIYIFCENYMGEHSGELYEEELNGAQIVWKDSAYIDLKWQHPGIRIFRKDVTSGIGHAFDGASYYSTKSGTLYAVDSLGNLLWKKKYGGYASDLICVRGDTLFFGTSAGTLYAVNRTDGDVIWRTNIGDSIISGVFEYGGVIYFGAKDGNFYAVDRGDGSVIWSFSTGGAIRAMPGYGFGFLHGGSCDDTLYKIGAGTGVEQAKYGTDGDIVNIPAFGRVAGSHYRIYFGNIKKNVYCLDSLRAQPYDLIWQDVLNAPAIKGPWYWWGKIYFADTLGNIYCYDIDGNPNPWGWAQYPLNISAKPTTKPLVYNGKIYIGTEKGLIAVSEKTGKILWKFDPGQKIESTPMLNVAQGVITFTTSGKIFRIGIGGAKWKRKNGMNPNVKVRKSM